MSALRQRDLLARKRNPPTVDIDTWAGLGRRIQRNRQERAERRQTWILAIIIIVVLAGLVFGIFAVPTLKMLMGL